MNQPHPAPHRGLLRARNASGPRGWWRVAAVLALSLCPALPAQPVLLCGGKEVLLLDTAAAQAGRGEKLWRWSADTAPGLPDELRRRFVNLDECKPVAGGRLLISASSGGCALVERASGRALWHAQVANAHTLELLPRNRVAAASSLGGDALLVYDLARPNEPRWRTRLYSAHGLVWDHERQCLWALGYSELRRYGLQDWETEAPSLVLLETHCLPDDNGHDLQAMPGSPDLVLTTHAGVYLFDRQAAEFRPHPGLGSLAKVKSVSVHPCTGRGILSFWSRRLSLFGPDGAFDLVGDPPYKARWDVEDPAP